MTDIHLYKEYQFYHKNQNSNFYRHLIFKIMKKQILFLAFFILAILASTTNSFGQLNPSTWGTLPIPLVNCLGDAQHPKAGNSYTYTLSETGTNATATDFRFWATKDPNFISTIPTVTNQADSLKKVPGELLDYSANYQTGGLTPSVDITWSPEILSGTAYQDPTQAPTKTPTFVVGWATDGCTDNIKVWEIDPSPSFTVDITNIAANAALAYATTTTQCVDLTRAAKYNTTSFGIDYNYGADTLYYEVIASNFVTSWTPTFFLTGLDGTIQEAEIGWASSYANARAGTLIESGDITSGTLAGTTALTSSVPTTNGVSLIVRVVITNHNYETLAQETIALSVAGEDADGFDIIDDAACTVPADAATAAVDDVATRTIDPRPTIIEGTTIILPNGGTTAP
ncbi:MAG: hypothetical protein WC384_05800 [Prolixibacteraceae bacterium]